MSEAFRAWALTPIATAYLIVAEGKETLPKNTDEAKIRSWMVTLGTASLAWISRTHTTNNLAYWAGSGVILAGIAGQRRDFFNAAIALADHGIDTTKYDGTLPSEISRGQRALEYHIFALTPLTLIAQAASVNGVDLFARNHQALKRVADRITASRNDHSFFEKAAKAKQSAPYPLPAGDWAWAEIILLHYKDPPLAAIVKPLRPIRFDRAGGDVTLLYGAP